MAIKEGSMTDNELNQVRQLILADGQGAGLKAYLLLTAKESKRMLQLAKQESNTKARELMKAVSEYADPAPR